MVERWVFVLNISTDNVKRWTLSSVTCNVLLSVRDVHISGGFKVRLYPTARKTSMVHRNVEISQYAAFSKSIPAGWRSKRDLQIMKNWIVTSTKRETLNNSTESTRIRIKQRQNYRYSWSNFTPIKVKMCCAWHFSA